MSWIENNDWLDTSKRARFDARSLGRFFGLLDSSRALFPALALAGILGASCVWFVPSTVARIDAALREGDRTAAVWGLVALAAIATAQTVTTALVRLGGAYLATHANARVVTTFFDHVLGARVDAFLQFRRRTNLFQRVIDALGITREYTDTLLQASIVLLMLPVYLAVMFIVSRDAGTALLAVWLVLACTAGLFGVRLRRLRTATLAAGYPLVEKMLEIIEGLLTIKALSGAVRMTQDVADLVLTKKRAERSELVTDALAAAVGQLCSAVGVSLCVGAAVIANSGVSAAAGTLVSVWLIATFAVPIGAQAVTYLQSLQLVSSNIDAFFETLALTQESPLVPAMSPLRGAPSASEPDAGDCAIVLQGVSFGYPGGEPVLSDVTFSITPGESVCIVGPSGAGKTTLFRLLLGFMSPTRGSIRVHGEELTPSTDIAAYRRRFGVVSQRDFFFGISLLDNLTFGMDAIPSPCAVRDVLDRVGLSARVERLPKHLDHRYTPNVFSGGEEQRFFLARALLRRPEIVLLDEPTSSLDFENEELVIAAMDALTAGRTTLTIAHRLSTVRAAERVIVLAQGRVVGDGQHDALLATNEYYRALCSYNSFLLS